MTLRRDEPTDFEWSIIQPATIEALFSQALDCHQKGHFDQACALYDVVLARTPSHAASLHMLGLAHYQAGRTVDALNRLEDAVAADPANADFWNSLGVAAQTSGAFDQAQHAFEQAALCRPGFAEANNNLGTLHHTQGTLDAARVAFELALRHQPTYANARYNLAVTLQALGRTAEACQAFMDLLEIDPHHAAGHFGLGQILADLGETNRAADAFERALRLEPQDPLGARVRLAALGRGPTPDRASTARLQWIYHKKADEWDRNPGCGGADLVCAALAELPMRKGWDVLDAGCGTGLAALSLPRDVRSLHGVDLSPAMLAKAREKNLYTELHQGNLLDYMALRPCHFDLIISSATLIHFGDLEATFKAAAGALRPDGVFVFTVFSYDDVDPLTFSVHPHALLMEGGCYAHGSHYVDRTATRTGFRTLAIRSAIHDKNEAEAIMGLVVVLVRL